MKMSDVQVQIIEDEHGGRFMLSAVPFHILKSRNDVKNCRNTLKDPIYIDKKGNQLSIDDVYLSIDSGFWVYVTCGFVTTREPIKNKKENKLLKGLFKNGKKKSRRSR